MTFKSRMRGGNITLPPGHALSDGAEVLVSTVETEQGKIVPKYGIVAFFDILGFSKAMQNSSISALVQAVRDSRAEASRQVQSARLHFGRHCEMVTFSDSILIAIELPEYQPGSKSPGHYGRLLAFLYTTTWFFTEMFWAGWPLRGGIDIGEYYLNSEEKLIVGPCISRAHDLESKQIWSGCAFTSEAALVIQKYHEYGGWLVDYAVPPREVGELQSRHALDWREHLLTRRSHQKFLTFAPPPGRDLPDFVRGRFQANGKPADHTQVLQKIQNTLKFLQSHPELTNRWTDSAAET